MNQEQTAKLCRMGGAAATVGVAASVHAAAEHLPLGQIMALRAGVSGVLILLYGLSLKRAELWPRSWRLHLIRGLLACCAMVLAYIAFARLPVTQAQTLTYLAPLLVVPLAAWQLGERLTPRLILALALGFLGMLMVLGLSFDLGPTAIWGALCGIGAAVFMALIQVHIRAMIATESALSTALSFTIIVTLVSGLSVLSGTWLWPMGEAFWVLLAAGVFGALNLVLFAESLARAPASTVAPLDYTGLIWALLVDWFVFAELPAPIGIFGAVLITLAALIVVLRPSQPIKAGSNG